MLPPGFSDVPGAEAPQVGDAVVVADVAAVAAAVAAADVAGAPTVAVDVAPDGTAPPDGPVLAVHTV